MTKIQRIVAPLTTLPALKFIRALEQVAKKLPKLPHKLVGFFVLLAPWMVLAGIMIGLVSGVLQTLLTLLSLITFDLGFILSYLLTLLFSLAFVVVLLNAYMPLKKNEMLGWVYLFWSETIGLLWLVIRTVQGDQPWTQTVLATLIGFYVLFQMKDKYLKKG